MGLSLDLVMVIGSACLLISEVDTYSRSSQLCKTIECRAVLFLFDDVVESLLNIYLYMVCFVLNHT